MEHIPQIKLETLTQEKIDRLEEGFKIYDITTAKFYEKRYGKFEPMVEETEEEEVVEESNDKFDASEIKRIVAEGNKLNEVNAFMKLKSARNELLIQKDTINQKINFMFNGTPEQIDLIQARVSEVTEDAVKAASLEDLKKFFIFEENEVELNIEVALSEEERIEAYREFLLYLKTIDTTTQEIDKQLEEIDFLCSNFSEEVVEKSKSIYEWDNYIYELFKERLKVESISEEERARISRLIEIKDDALNLKPLYDVIKKDIDAGHRKSMIHAFRYRFEDTLIKANKYAIKNNFHLYFQLFDGVEEELGYGEFRNLFVYLFARYIKYHHENFSKIDNAFIAQITQNLIMLKKDQLKEPAKTTFTNAIKGILELVIKAS